MHHSVPMATYQTRLRALTTSVPDFVDVTEDIAESVAASGVTNGRVTVFTGDESCSIMVNERESGLLSDIKRTIERLTPGDPKASRSVIGSPSVVLPVIEGRLRLGMWQRVLLVELNEACERSVDIHIIGER